MLEFKLKMSQIEEINSLSIADLVAMRDEVQNKISFQNGGVRFLTNESELVEAINYNKDLRQFLNKRIEYKMEKLGLSIKK